ncbi:MAG: hypothetical protein N2044_00280 [Cyclobacteriaceae bacterium]|nr:hypothetical protein [Cyclobacteriaceae bacterium]
MKSQLLILLLILHSAITFAQDEGQAVAMERFERDKGFYISGGKSINIGKNLGDYSGGLGFEVGFMKRFNKVLSIGPNFNYLSYEYDESKTYPYYYDSYADNVFEYFQQGGNIRLISLGCNFKLNIIPVSEDTKVSLYGIANPFASYMKRDSFTGWADVYADDDGNGIYTDYQYTSDMSIPAYEEDAKFTGGVQLGFGVEFMPVKPVSIFLQTTFGYTLPITYSDTKSFLIDADRYVDSGGTVYYDTNQTIYTRQFPIVNKGFGSMVLRAGVYFNF